MIRNVRSKKVLTIPSVYSFFIKDDWLCVRFDNRLEVFSLSDKRMESKIKIMESNRIRFNLFNKRLIVQYKTSLKVFDEKGKLLGENYRYPHLPSTQVSEQKIIFQTYDQLRNRKRYLTELDLETIEMVEWEWIYSDYDELVGFYNNNLLIFSYDLNLRKYYLKYINKKTFASIWKVCLDEFNPNLKVRVKTNFKILDEKVIFTVGDTIVCLDIYNGKKIWKTNNLGFSFLNMTSYNAAFFLYWQDQVFIIPTVGDYIVIDLITGKEIKKIKNWSESVPYKIHSSRWNERIKIYDDFFMIADIEIFSNCIHFFDKKTGRELYKFELGQVRWDRENLEYYDGKLYVKTSEKEEGPYTLKIFELDFSNIV